MQNYKSQISYKKQIITFNKKTSKFKNWQIIKKINKFMAICY